MKRRTQGHGVVSVVEFIVMGAWAAAAWCLSTHPPWTPLPLLVAGLGSTATWLLGRPARREQDGSAPA